MNHTIKAVFLDRDGVINHDLGYVVSEDRFIFVPDIFTSLRLLRNAGFKLFIITNQSAIARGLATCQQVDDLHTYMQRCLSLADIHITEVVYCPHHPCGIIDEYRKSCECRKPKPGMINYLINKYAVNIDQSFLIGDSVRDIEAGCAAGLSRSYHLMSNHSMLESVRSILDYT